MEIKEYKLNQEAKAVLTCLDGVAKLHSNILETLLMYYPEECIATLGIEKEYHKIGGKMMKSIEVLRDELLNYLNTEILDELYNSDKQPLEVNQIQGK